VSHLVTATALSDKLSDITTIDVRWRLGGPPGRRDYDAGHLPGAAFVDLDADLCGVPGAAGRHPLPDPADLQTALRGAGVRHDRPVVVYDHGDGLAAARAWWTLRWAGHPNVRVLDGGFAAWIAAGLPVEPSDSAGPPAGFEQPDIAAGDFTVEPGHLPVLDADGAAAVARAGVLLDARAAARYRGEVELIDSMAGHIPGAGNVPQADLVEADGRLRSPDELRARFAAAGVKADTAAGVKADTAVAAYCGSGVTAAHTVLALAEAGIDDVGLYVGSWSNWIAEGRPVAIGNEPGNWDEPGNES
jgi:thiosulfate/3-mercaptopyruvate sulfurtransferase